MTGAALEPVARVDADAIRSRLDQKVSTLASAASRVGGAHDPDAIHDLRVSARVLDAMLRTWAGLLEPRATAAALRALRRLRRRLGAARELEVHAALIERSVAAQGEPVMAFLHRLQGRLARRSARAAKRLRRERLRRLLQRVEAAAASLGAQPASDARASDRARAHVSEMRAVALAAVDSASAREDDWLLHQARLAVKKWRYAAECVDRPANERGSDLRAALRRVQDALGTIQDRAALIESLERHARKRGGTGFEALIGELKTEKGEAFRSFQALAGTLGPAPAAPPRAVRVVARPIAGAPASVAPTTTDERWERMAQWLLGATSQQ